MLKNRLLYLEHIHNICFCLIEIPFILAWLIHQSIQVEPLYNMILKLVNITAYIDCQFSASKQNLKIHF